MPAFRFKSGSEVSWVTLSGGSGAWTYTITAENRALVAGGSRSATIEAQYSLDVGGVQTLLVCDVPISQVANFVETVSVSDASFAYSTIAAAGATVTPITDSTIAITMSSGSTLSSASAIVGYTYALTPSFSMTNGSGFTLNSTTTGSLTAASMGTTLGSRQSPTITYSLSLTYTPSSELSALSAKTVSGSDSSTGTATQGVNEVTSSTLAVTAFNYTGTVAASGGTSAAPNITVLKNLVYTSGATDSVPVTTYTKTFSIVNDYDSGATVDASAGLVTFLSRGTTVGLLLNIQVGLVVSADGLSANSQAGCTQAMNKIESFVVMDISFDWPQFSPAGESHLPRHVGEWCQATYSSGVVGERAKPPVGYTIASNTAVYSLAESSSVFTIVDASTGEVSAANMGRALGSRTSPYIWKDITIVLAAGSWANGTVENISGTGRARNVANQGVNAIGFRDLTITSFAYSATPTVSASGGTSVPTLAATETQFYTSGTVDKNIAVPLPEGSFALTTSGHGASVDSSTGVVTYASRGSVAGDAWSDSVTWTLTSHGLTATKSASVSQEANTAAYASPSITASYDDDIPAGGGTVSLTKSFTQSVTYTSGSTGTVSSGGTWSYSQSSGSGLNTSTGAVTAASLGTTAKARSQVASVRVQLTANSKTEAVMASAYQEANSRTWGTPTITTFEYRGTPAVNTLSAGADNRTPTLLATQTGTWTSGETETASLISSKTFTGGDVNTSTGNYTVTSLGNVVTARKLEATITVNITMNGKTASDSLSLYREANEVTYSDPVVTHTSPISVDASAGQYQLKPNFTQRAYYTSGSETPILSGSFTYAVKTALTGFTLAPPSGIVSYTANPSVSPRNGFVVTITGSGNGKSGTTDVTFNQAGANPTIWVSLNGTSYGSSVTVNLEGKSASEVSVYVKTNDTFDVS